MGKYNHEMQGSFYQYAFSKGEFRRIIEKLGFRITFIATYESIRGLTEEISYLRRFCRSNRRPMEETTKKNRLYDILENKTIHSPAPRKVLVSALESKLFREFCGHMIIFVAKLTNRNQQRITIS